jgi:hypothetical protein
VGYPMLMENFIRMPDPILKRQFGNASKTNVGREHMAFILLIIFFIGNSA